MIAHCLFCRRRLTRFQVKWLAVLLNKGVDPVSGNVVVPRSVYDAVTTAQHIEQGTPSSEFGSSIAGYGMGWERWTYDGIEVPKPYSLSHRAVR